jgi:hypothetical protein
VCGEANSHIADKLRRLAGRQNFDGLECSLANRDMSSPIQYTGLLAATCRWSSEITIGFFALDLTWLRRWRRAGNQSWEASQGEGGSSFKQLFFDILKRFEFQRVAAWVQKEHRCLFTGFAFEANVGLDHKFNFSGL